VGSYTAFATRDTLLAGATHAETILFDCSDPAAPTPVGTITRHGRLEFSGGLLAVMGSGIWLYDVSDPAAPELVTSIAYESVQYPEYFSTTYVLDAELLGDQLVVVTNGYVQTGDWIHGDVEVTNTLRRRRFDLGDPANPVETASLHTRTTHDLHPFLDFNLMRHGDLLVDGRAVFDPLSDDLATLSVLPVRQPVPGGVASLDAEHLVVCSDQDVTIAPLGAAPVDNVAEPLVLGENGPGRFLDAAAGTAFLVRLGMEEELDHGWFRSYLSVYAEPGAAAVAELAEDYWSPMSLDCAGSTIAIDRRLVRVGVDFSLTSHWLDTEGVPRAVSLRDQDHLAVATSANQLELWDVTDHAAPVRLGVAALPTGFHTARDVVWEGDVALVAGNPGLAAVRIDDPTAPVTAGVLAGGPFEWVATAGTDRALVQHETALVLVDLADLDAPAGIAWRHAGVLGGRPVVQQGYAYATVEGLLSVYDVATLDALGTLAFPGEDLGALGLWGNALVGAGRSHGGWAHLPPACEIDLTPVSDAPTAATALLGAAPNPFNPRTTIRFRLDRQQSVRLTVLDLRGRLVRELATGHWPAGDHAVGWDGRDDSGAAAASGSYLLRLETDQGVRATRATLVK
jgi:hypothetical protein